MALQKPALDLDWLSEIHVRKRLELTMSTGLSGTVHLNGSSHNLVTELIRLARVGQAAERVELGLPAIAAEVDCVR